MALAMLMFAAALAPVHLIDEVDPMTGRPTVHVIVGGKKQFVAVGCDGAKDYKPEVIVKFGHRIGVARPALLSGGREMIYRLEDNKPERVRWFSWKDQVLAGAFPTKAGLFIRAFMYSRSASFRTVANDGTRLDMSLDYARITELVGEAMRKCGVTLP